MAIESYDPNVPPEELAWLETDEQERIRIVKAYHHGIGEMSEENVHSTLHVIVENQFIMGERMPVREKVRQLMAQGLSRHDSLHAIAICLVKHLDRLSRSSVEGDQEERYFADVRRMSARKYMAMRQ
ncbi:MAG: hypothetical protein AB7F35_18885 [Acetobacteraceae bacterium]